jgi:AraC family transcriptional regulator, glycine betaine-responsive activator
VPVGGRACGPNFMSAAQHPVPRFARSWSSAPRSAHGSSGINAPFAVDALDGKIRLDILLLPEFDLFDLAVIEEIAAIVNRRPGRHRFEIGLRGICDGQVRVSCGVEVTPGSCRPAAPNLLVLGGSVRASDQYSPWRFRLRRAAYESARVFSVAGGTFALATAGLLDGEGAAAPWRSAAAWGTLAPKVRFVSAEWTEGRKFHSCLGGRALLQFMLHCVSRQLGVGIAAEIALALNVESHPPRPSVTGGRDRLPPYCHPALRDAIRAIHRSLDKQLEIADICASAKGVSERTLQRLFRRHLGTTVGAYHRASRLEHARELLRLTSLSVMEVALTAGFESATHFSQCYGKHFGCTPRRDR